MNAPVQPLPTLETMVALCSEARAELRQELRRDPDFRDDRHGPWKEVLDSETGQRVACAGGEDQPVYQAPEFLAAVAAEQEAPEAPRP